MEQNFNVNRSFNIFCDKLTSNNVGKDLIIESSYNSIDFCCNELIFDGEVYFNRVICNYITISNISEISTKFLKVNSMTLPTEVKILYNSVNDGYIINTRVGINSGGIIRRSDAYFTYINVSGGDSSFNKSVYINKNLRVDGILTISNNLIISGNNFASIDNSFNIYKLALEQSFFSNKISTKDVSAIKISISNELYVNKTAYINDLTISGQLLNNVLKVPNIFTIDPSGYNNHSGTLNINGDLIVKGRTTSFLSSIVDICDNLVIIASNLVNILDLSNTNAGLDISNIASLKYNGTNWNFSGGQLTVDNKKVMFDVSLIDATNSFALNLNALKTDFSSSFFRLQKNIDNSYNATYRRSQIDNSFILKSNFDISLTSLNSYVDNSYILVNIFDTSLQGLKTLMDISYIAKSRVGNINSFDISFDLFNTKVDLSNVLKTVFEASHNSLKTRFDNSFANINANNINTTAITIEEINTRHSSQRFANSLWNQIGLDISNGPPPLTNNNKKIAVSNDGKVVALSSSSNSDISKGRIYVYELSYNQTSYNWIQLGLSSEIIVGVSNDDQFGWDVALSSNGRVVAGSSINSDASGNNSGQVRIFELSNNTNRWLQKGFNINGPRPASESGYSISLAGNGNSIAIGAWKDNSNGTNAGAVRVYDFSVNVNDWRQRGQTIAGVSGSYEGYATALSLDGQTLASTSIIPEALSISGGTISISGGYIIHSFRTVGTSTFTPAFTGTVEVLIVGGGGGGGSNIGGGGGAGPNGTGKALDTNSNIVGDTGQTGMGSGGLGYSSAILGTSYYWAGGGGGSAYSAGASTVGGYGGWGGGGGGSGLTGGGLGGGFALVDGSNGSIGANSAGGNGGTNTGGGGGGGGNHIIGVGGKGGSGIVIIRYVADNTTPTPVKTFTWSGTSWINKGAISGPQIYLTDISYDINNTLIPSQGQILGEPFTLSGTTYSNTDYNGYGSALNSDGTIFAISSASSPARGCVRVYKFNGTSWQLMGPIIYGTATNNIIVWYSYILNTLQLSYDGRTIATLVSGSTATFGIYRYNDVSWNNTGYLSNGRATPHGPGVLSGDGNTFVMSDDTAGSGGIVYAWKYINNVWTTIAAIANTFSPTFLSWAMSLGISYDGNTLVGSSRIYPSNADQQGYARVFKYNGIIWNQLGPVILGPRPIREFGFAASMSADGLTISIGGYTDFRVFKYNAIDVSWQLTGIFPVTSGLVAYSYLSADGTTVATWYSNKAFIWKYRSGSWVKIVESSDGTGWNGNALSADGTVYATCHTSPTYIKIHKLTTTVSNIIINENLLYSINKAKYLNLFFGRNIKLSSNGNKIVIGATGPTINGLDFTLNINYLYYQAYRYNQGSIYVYEYVGTTWRQLGQTLHGLSSNDEFGSSVSMSNDGTIISAGSNNNVTNSGYVRVFVYANNYWYQVSNTLSGKTVSSKAGTHVLSGDGTILIQSNNTYNNAYGINKNLSFIPSSTTITTTISGDLMVGGKTYLNSLKISNRHIFDVSGYSSNYLATTDISASIVEYYSNVGYNYNRVFRIDACGNITNYSGFYGAISDSRLKENIVNCTPKLEDLLKVRVVNYNLKGQDTSKYIGVVAQELEEIFPELVAETNTHERFKSVNYSNLTILLIKAFQEQQVLINNLNASLEELENEILKNST